MNHLREDAGWGCGILLGLGYRILIEVERVYRVALLL
jgi:hypothetical protein